MVRSLNKVQIIGNLGRDPEMRYTPSGAAVTNFTVAVNRRRRDPQGGQMIEETEWFRVVAWEKLAETCNEFLRKGRPVYIEGRLQSSKYTDKEGIERTSWDVVANDMIMLDGRDEGGEAGQGGGRGMMRESAPEERAAPRQSTPASGGRQPQRPSRPAADEYESDLDDVPF